MDCYGSDHRPVYATFKLQPRNAYPGPKIYAASCQQGYLHTEIHMSNLQLISTEEGGQALDAKEALTVSIYSSVLEKKVTLPNMGYSKTAGGWTLSNKADLVLVPFVYDSSFLQTCHLMFRVASNKARKNYNSDDEDVDEKSLEVKEVEDDEQDKGHLYGYGVVSLWDAIRHNKTQVPFETVITQQGLFRARLSGTFTVKMAGSIDTEKADDMVQAMEKHGASQSMRTMEPRRSQLHVKNNNKSSNSMNSTKQVPMPAMSGMGPIAMPGMGGGLKAAPYKAAPLANNGLPKPPLPTGARPTRLPAGPPPSASKSLNLGIGKPRAPPAGQHRQVKSGGGAGAVAGGSGSNGIARGPPGGGAGGGRPSVGKLSASKMSVVAGIKFGLPPQKKK